MGRLMKQILVKMLKNTSEMITSKQGNVISVDFKERFKIKNFSASPIMFGSTPVSGDFFRQEEKPSHLKLVRTETKTTPHLTLVKNKTEV